MLQRSAPAAVMENTLHDVCDDELTHEVCGSRTSSPLPYVHRAMLAVLTKQVTHSTTVRERVRGVFAVGVLCTVPHWDIWIGN